MSLIKNLQQKTKKEKNKILWILVSVCASIVLVLWITVFPKDFIQKKSEQKSIGDLKKDFKEDNKEFDEYMDSLEIFQEFEEGFDLEKIIEETMPDEELYEDVDKKEAQRDYLRLPLEE